MALSDLESHYDYLWKKATLTSSQIDLDNVAWNLNKLLAGYKRYAFIQEKTGIPWFLVGAIHGHEASFNFNTCLHNGDPLPGPTVHVPAGRGPFKSWEDACMDALQKMSKEKNWTILKCLERAEAYNGLGYLKYHPDIPSPYLWACTSVYPGKGKYTSDGKFDPEAKTAQVGVAALMIALLGVK